MKTSAFKFAKFWINKIDFYSLKKYLNKKTISISIGIFLLLIIFTYLLRPVFFDYDLKKGIIQDKIKNNFKLNAKINGKISFRILPSPNLLLENVILNFDKNDQKPLTIKEVHVPISPLKINNIKLFLLFIEYKPNHGRQHYWSSIAYHICVFFV